LFSPKAVEDKVAPERKPRHKKKTIFRLPLVKVFLRRKLLEFEEGIIWV